MSPTMNVPRRLLSDRVSSVRQALTDVVGAGNDPARPYLPLLLWEYEQLPEALRQATDSAFVAAMTDTELDVSELVQMREGLERAADEMIAATTEAHSRFPAPGRNGDSADRLQKVVEDLRRIKADFSARWPVCNASEMNEALAEYARGEYQDITDAFAEIAGVSREEWLRRVEERKRKRQSDTPGA